MQKSTVSARPQDGRKKRKRLLAVTLVAIFLLLFSIIMLNFRSKIVDNTVIKVLKQELAPFLEAFKKSAKLKKPTFLQNKYSTTQGPTAVKSTICRVDGIIYSIRNPSVIIGGEIYSLNDSVCGGKIVTISANRITVKSQGRQESYQVGDNIESR